MSPEPASQLQASRPPLSRVVDLLVVAAASLSMLFPPIAAAHNVATFTSAKITLLGQPAPGPPTIGPFPMDLDPNNPPNDPMDFSIPMGTIAEIEIKGTAAADGVVGLKLMDDDLDENFRGWDDELENPFSLFPVAAGEEFFVVLHCSCSEGDLSIKSLASSGEQSAEIFIQDGDHRIPLPRNLPGGGQKRSWWRIDCDKDTTWGAVTPQGISGSTTWGDTL